VNWADREIRGSDMYSTEHRRIVGVGERDMAVAEVDHLLVVQGSDLPE
jgi:hypothetical protein